MQVSDKTVSRPKVKLCIFNLVLCIGCNLGLKFGRKGPLHAGSDRFLPVNAVMKG